MKRRPGIEKAKEFILSNIDTGKFCAGMLLPSIKELARFAGVSFVTMWKSIDALRNEGVLESKSGGKRMMVSAKGARPPSIRRISLNEVKEDRPVAGPLWQVVKERIKRDILTGRYQAGMQLPSHKELQSFYDVSFPTLKKALDVLASEEIITAFHKGYMVPALSASDNHTRIVALGCGWEDGRIWTDYLDKNYFRILETECINAKIGLDIVVYYRTDDELNFIHSATLKPYDLKGENVLGIVYVVANLEINPEEILKKVAILKKPVAVLDVVGGWSFPEFVINSPHFHFFTATATTRPAIQVAQYLLSMGHKRVAYFSPFHKAFWSQIRYQGIVDTYRTAGYPEGVTPYILDQYRYQWDYLQDREDPEDISQLIEEYNKWKTFATNDFFRRFGNISYSISRYLTEWNCASGEIFHRMVPLFEKALAYEDITAWIMANDFAATLALDFLKERNVKTPQHLSVIAFDNTLGAMENRLTSYDFNSSGIISWMLRFITRPSSFGKAKRKKVFEPEGTIVERRTTGQAT